MMGGSKSGNKLNSVERYTETGWSDVQPMPTPRNSLAVAVLDNLLYAIGGYNSDQGDLNTVEMYNPRAVDQCVQYEHLEGQPGSSCHGRTSLCKF